MAGGRGRRDLGGRGYHLLPLGFNITATGNLTNMFGQAIAIFAFAMVAGDAPRVNSGYSRC